MITIRTTVEADVATLTAIQREAFLPLYERYHDAGNPCLREREFADAVRFIVDFPQDLEKNRRCYEKAGFVDTGRRLEAEPGLVLACFDKRVNE